MMIECNQEEITKNWNPSTSAPLVSICCITYNHESYIEQALHGFLMQETSFPFEILIHDDASSDKTPNIIQKYEKKYPDIVKPIYQTENQYSKGNDVIQINLARSQGKYIAICEGDDYWIDPHKLQKQVDFLETHPEYSMCFHKAQLKFESNLYTDLTEQDIQDKCYSATELLERWIAPLASIVMKRSCAFYPLKNKAAILTGDIFIIFSCLAMGKVWGFSKAMSVYRVNQGGVSHNPSHKKNNLMRLPDNWESFKQNFPFAPQKRLKKILAFHYWQRSRIQPTLKLSLMDRRKAISYSPMISFFMIFRPAVMSFAMFLGRFFDKTKVMNFISNITHRI